MGDVTRILEAIEGGNPQAANDLLPLVYEELRKLAGDRLAQEKPGQTLQATALVHEAYIRLVDAEKAQQWNSRGHFFAAAAEAMRRIMVERARHKATAKAGGDLQRVPISEAVPIIGGPDLDVIALDEALQKLESEDPRRARVVKLRFFAGLSSHQAADAIGIAPSTAAADWAYAKCWLQVEMTGHSEDGARSSDS